MGLISDMFNGLTILSFLAFVQNGCSIKNMAEKAMSAHRKGLTSYKAYSNKLTGYKEKRR